MPAEPRGATIHRAEASHEATADEPASTLAVGESLTAKCEEFSGLSAPCIETAYEVEAATGDLILRQRATHPRRASGGSAGGSPRFPWTMPSWSRADRVCG